MQNVTRAANAMRQVVRVLNQIRPDATPPKEKDIASNVLQVLSSDFVRNNTESWRIARESVAREGRFDLLLVSDKLGLRIVIEIKRLASMECVSQLDRYSFRADATILVCWRATKPFKEIFQTAKCSIPIALIQLKQRAALIT